MLTRDRLIAASFAIAVLAGAAVAAPASTTPAPAPTVDTATHVKQRLAEVRGAVYARKTTAMRTVLKLDAAQRAKFDPMLDAYDAELKKIGDRQAALIMEFAGYYDAKSLDDANATRLVDESYKIKRDALDLLHKHYGLMSKAIGVRKAGEWVQLEYAFMSSVDSKIALEVPVLSDAMKD